MELTGSVRIALRALGANKLRSALTMLGVIIGVGAVIALMSIGTGMQEQITSQVRGLGTNLLFISPGAQQTGGVSGGAGSRPTLTLDDSEALSNAGMPFVANVAAAQDSGAQLVAGGQNWRSRVSGVTPSFQEVRNAQVALGEFINAEHMQSHSRVMVLGSNVAQELFGDNDPIGETIRTNSQSFRVIGVLESKGANALGNQDDVVYIPLTTMQTRFNRQFGRGGAASISSIAIQLTDEQYVDAAVQEISALLREQHNVFEDDFTILSQEDMVETVSQITAGITLFLGAVAGISLLVGGIGIMNIMLVSVTERTREIGIRKALGAKRSNILSQFLIEATVVSLLGGGLGIVIGVGASQLLSGIELSGLGLAGNQAFQTVVPPDSVVLAFVVSAAIGLFFGSYPALRAAQLNPIEALRYE